MILGLSYMSYGNFKRFNQSLSEVKLPEIEIPEINFEEALVSQEKESLEWISPDGKLKLAYSGNWTETAPSSLGYLDEANVILGEAELLLFTQQFDLNKQSFILLTVEKNKSHKSLEEIIEEAEQAITEQGGKSEINIIREDDGTVWIETVSEYPNQPNLYSKGKVLFGEEEIYIVLLTTLEMDWPKFEQEAREIFDSALLVLQS
jgi:hypothetical protein